MIKKNQTFFDFIQIIIDMLTIALALLLAYWIRFVSPFYTDGVREMNYVNYLHLLIFILPTFLVCYFIFGLYKPFRKVKFFKEVRSILLANSFGLLILVTYLYYTKDVNYSRLMLGYFYIASIIFIIIERYITRYVYKKLASKGFNQKQVIVVGAGEIGQTFVNKISEEKHLGYNVVGFIDDYFSKKEEKGVPILGKTKDLNNILNNTYVDEVVIALPNTSFKKINDVIDVCEFNGVKTQVIPDYINLLKGQQASIDELDGIPLINTRHVPLDNPFNEGLKRIADIIGSLLLITITSPLMLLIALGVKLTSPGPIIYKQARVGKNRKEFIIYKFRSMRSDQKGTKDWTVENDPRRTKFGTFLRKTSLDELPQFFNVLKGDMSLIGPRPELPYWVDQYRETIPHYMIKHHVRPGITGLSQIRGLRGDTDLIERIDTDIEYIENWTPFLDFKIVLKTPRAMLHGN